MTNDNARQQIAIAQRTFLQFSTENVEFSEQGIDAEDAAFYRGKASAYGVVAEHLEWMLGILDD
jgi:hypothetical protein